MSLSNTKVSISSPVKRYYSWNGVEGKLSYYDKDKGEKIVVDLPFTFIPIDQLSCVEGYSAKHENGFRSNEVRSTVKEELDVRWNRGNTIIKGLYSDIKAEVEKIGGKYHRSIYGVQQIDGQWEIINIRLKGAGMSSWLNFDKRSQMSLEGLTITINQSDLKKTGMVKYYEPVFSAAQTSEETHGVAVELDVRLQDYFKVRAEGLPSMSADEFMEVVGELTPEEKKQLVKPTPEKVNKKNIDEIEGNINDLFDELD